MSDKTICPICQHPDGTFDDWGGHKRGLCHQCHSLERTRAMADMWTKHMKWEIDLSGKKALLISPASSERMFFQHMGLTDITSLDARAEVKPDIQGDLCEADFIPDDTYDFIYASFVFPFLHDHYAALGHLQRILKPTGVFVNYVPVRLKHPTIRHNVGDGSRGWYGKENFEKYKIAEYHTFGDLGIIQDHARYFIVKTYYGRDVATGSEFMFLCCWPKEAARIIRE